MIVNHTKVTQWHACAGTRWEAEVELQSIRNLCARSGWLVSTTPRPLCTRKGPVPIVQQAGCASWPVWTGKENFATTGTRSYNRSVRSELLYWIRCSRINSDGNGNVLIQGRGGILGKVGKNALRRLKLK